MTKKKTAEKEYRLLIEPVFDETLKKNGILFYFETVKQFSNFNYEIAIEDVVEDGSLAWSIHGLRAPSMNMPSFGSARFSKIYFDLKKHLTLTIAKSDGEVNSFAIKFLKTGIVVEPQEKYSFVELFTSQQLFESTTNIPNTPSNKK